MPKNKKDNLPTRRQFLKSAISTSLAASSLGQLAKAQSLQNQTLKQHQKEHLDVLTTRPLNFETPPHLLDDKVTPTNRLFVRNNGIIPGIAYQSPPKNWSLTIDGAVKEKQTFTMADLEKKFPYYSYQLVLECGGNGRAGVQPPTQGLQWTYGAVGCPIWKGFRLKDILAACRLEKTAVYIGYYSYDIHPSGDPKKNVISRGFPLKKALEDTTLIATMLNDKPLPAVHGYPARLVVPGYPGSASGKWLQRLWVRTKPHDGEKMLGYSYRVPEYPAKPGSHVEKEQMKIIEDMPVKSLITYPKSATKIAYKKNTTIAFRGFAWAGNGAVKNLHVSADYGQTWEKSRLEKPVNAFSWQRWHCDLTFSSPGYYEIWARAEDLAGKMQPMVVPGWNPRGYLNNSMPRIAIELYS